MADETKFWYFTTRTGAAVLRFGTNTYLGCKVVDGQFVWTGAVTRIPEAEVKHPHNFKSYNRLLANGDLKRVTEKEYNAWLGKVKDAAIAARAKRGKSLDEGDGKGSQIKSQPTPRTGRKRVKKNTGDSTK